MTKTNDNYPGFSGAYHLDDCTFLLKLIGPADISKIETTDLAAQEADIQSGKAPYWLRVSREKPPEQEQLALYRQAMNANKVRFTRDIAALANAAYKLHRQSAEVTIVSLARAGTPVGVLLNRALKVRGVTSYHYSISIVRDKSIGLDLNALKWICQNHDPESILFVDGWTGKGGSYKTISRFYNTKIAWLKVNWALSGKQLAETDAIYLIGGDETVVTKAGKKTMG
ncbi:MAG: hypothetical protein HC888_19740 [Candidatus Competibacteraceae bacterium]|nr:hypothetical protein [Candidatus Competibacteraceae bacterium]